jgi:hypothetical protein
MAPKPTCGAAFAPKIDSKILQIFIDEQRESLILCVPRQAGQLHSSSWRSSALRVEPTLVRLLTKVGLCRVPERTAIFDSLVLSSQRDTDVRYAIRLRRDESDERIQNVVEQSQQKLNCALLVDFL